MVTVTGFGMKMTMTEQHDTPPPGHQLNFLEALQVASEDVSLRLIIGDWCPNFTNRIRRVRLAFDELKVSIHLCSHRTSRHLLALYGRNDSF